MTTTQRPWAAAPHRPPTPARTVGSGTPWVTATVAGAAVLLAGAPVTAIVQGTAWLGYAVAVVAVVVAAGLLLHRWGAPAVAAGQCAAILVLLTAVFTEGDGALDMVPGPTAFREFGGLLAGAGQQIDAGTAPVPATPEILFLVTAAVGLLAVAVHLAAVSAAAPAAAGVPLLAVFAVPAALADTLLPWWTMAAATAGFGLLLVVRNGSGARSAGTAGRAIRGLPAATALVACALVLALGVGTGAAVIGTAGRFEPGDLGVGGTGGSIGLNPFTTLRGQLEQTAPVELLRVRGLGRPSYLRALTLRDFVPDVGWQATRPGPGSPLPGLTGPRPGTSGDLVDVQIENLSFRDYWLPLYGVPLEVAGLPESQWLYDHATGTGYTARPRQEVGWRQRALLPAPSVAELRRADEASGGVAPIFLDTDGVAPQVVELAGQVVAGRGTPFERALALQDFFTGPGSQFRYSLATAPGGGADALVEFLTVGRTGYCEQFASAMAVMLRAVGIPARVAVGFTAGTDVGDYRSISTSDAHAWVEAWFPGVGWTTFDPTPLTDGRAITPPYVLEARGQAAADGGTTTEDDLQPGEQPAEEPTPALVEPEQPTPDAAASSPTDRAGLTLWPAAVGMLVAAALLAPAALRVLHRRRRLAAVAVGGPAAADAGWDELLAESTDRGVPSPPSDTVRGAARRLVREHRLDTESQQALRQMVAAVESSWFGSDHPGPGELSGPVRVIRSGIMSGSALPLRGRLLPRSVLDRLQRRPPARSGADPLDSGESPTPVRSGGGSAPPCGR